MGLPALAQETREKRVPELVLDSELPVARSRLKRVLDIAGASVLLLAAAPLFAVLAIAIRLDSKGPVLLRQERCGYKGRPFACLKFRSMFDGSDEGPHRRYVAGLLTSRPDHTNGDGVFKLVDDVRITRVGRWLRRTSLDELPQLWNVLRGEMSLVGPRPPLAYEVELYTPRQRERLRCRPGLTGLWQVSGRNSLSYQDMCEIDLRYLREWSHALDLRILARTLPVVLLNSGRAH